MNDVLQSLFWLLVTIAIVVPIHEYGHYRVAVACGVKVLRFSVGFGRVLWSRRFGRDGTEFALSAIPLGGYVRMLDARDPQQDIPPQELAREFTRKPLWQRAAIVAAGPAANLVAAVVFFAFVQWHGVEDAAAVLGTPPAGSLMAAAGARPGDRVLAAASGADPAESDWSDVHGFADLRAAVVHAVMERGPLQLRVARPGEPGTRILEVGTGAIAPDDLPAADERLGLGAPFSATRLGQVVAGSAAAAAGVRAGDVLLAIDGRPVADGAAARQAILAASPPDATPKPTTWTLRRDARTLDLTFTPRLETVRGQRIARAGVAFGDYEHVFVRATPLEAIHGGVVQTWETARDSLRMFGRMVVGEASIRNLSGPVTIAEVANASASRGAMDFIAFLALISVSLAVLNLLPIPVLDGGTLLYYLFEGATGRPVPELWQARLQYGGLLVILLLMSTALFNDSVRHLGQP